MNSSVTPHPFDTLIGNWRYHGCWRPATAAEITQTTVSRGMSRSIDGVVECDETVAASSEIRWARWRIETTWMLTNPKPST